MIDLHCHLLWSIDDGCATLQDTLAMAAAMSLAGVTAVGVTPHLRHDLEWVNVRPGILAKVAQLRVALAAAGTALEVQPGCEHYLTPELFEHVQRGEHTPYAGGPYMLVEVPYTGAPPDLAGVLFRLRCQQIIPLLAHVERYARVGVDLKALHKLHEQGIPMQVNLGSLTGAYGRDIQKQAMRVLDAGLAHVASSDCHAPADVEPADGVAGWAGPGGDVTAPHLQPPGFGVPLSQQAAQVRPEAQDPPSWGGPADPGDEDAGAASAPAKRAVPAPLDFLASAPVPARPAGEAAREQAAPARAGVARSALANAAPSVHFKAVQVRPVDVVTLGRGSGVAVGLAVAVALAGLVALRLPQARAALLGGAAEAAARAGGDIVTGSLRVRRAQGHGGLPHLVVDGQVHNRGAREVAAVAVTVRWRDAEGRPGGQQQALAGRTLTELDVADLPDGTQPEGAAVAVAAGASVPFAVVLDDVPAGAELEVRAAAAPAPSAPPPAAPDPAAAPAPEPAASAATADPAPGRGDEDKPSPKRKRKGNKRRRAETP